MPNPAVLAYYSDPVFNHDAAARVDSHTAPAELDIKSALQFFLCALCGLKNYFCLNQRLRTHNHVLKYLLSGAVADIDELDILDIVQATRFDTETSNVTFERLRDLDLVSMELCSGVTWLPY